MASHGAFYESQRSKNLESYLNKKQKVLCHTLFFKMKDIPAEDMAKIQALCTQIRMLKGVLTYSFAPASQPFEGCSSRENGYTHAIHSTFSSADALKAYDTAPVHEKLKGLTKPFCKEGPTCVDVLNDAFPQIYGSGHTMHGPVYKA